MSTANLPRDVILDLWPLYASGEASDASRQLVEAAIAADPTLAEMLVEEGTVELPEISGTSGDDRNRLRALVRTRRLLLARSWTLAVAIFVTMMPLLLGFDAGGVTFLVAGNPTLLAVVLIAIPLAWGIHIWLWRRLRVTGL
jgi:hypothetical protein